MSPSETPPPGMGAPRDPGDLTPAIDPDNGSSQVSLDAWPVGLVVHGPRGELILANRAARELLDLEDAARGGRSWLEAADGAAREDGTPFAPSDHPGPRALVTRRPVRGVIMGFARGKERVWALVSAEPVLEPDGAVRHVLCTLCDVTEQRRAEERLRESEQRYRQLVEKAHEFIYRIDQRGRFTYVNPAASRVTGRPAGELLGRRALTLVRRDQRGRVMRALARQVRERATSTYDELVITAGDGRQVYIGQNVQLVADARGVHGLQAVARELSFGTRRAVSVAEPRHAAPPAESTSTRPRVLVVDDNDVNLKVTVLMLENLGYSADTAANGLEAVDACAREPYDAVLMDCQMPELDGFRATAFIRQREGQARHTPIIALTASILPGERQKCLAAGMDDFLCKPVGLRQLDETLRRWTLREKAESSASRFVLPAEHPLRALEMQGLGSLVAEVFGTFLETTPAYLREMCSAHRREDSAHLVSLAHSLKGAAVQVGADDVAELCAQIQIVGRRGDLADVEPLLTSLESAYEELRRTLEPQRQRLTQDVQPD